MEGQLQLTNRGAHPALFLVTAGRLRAGNSDVARIKCAFVQNPCQNLRVPYGCCASVIARRARRSHVGGPCCRVDTHANRAPLLVASSLLAFCDFFECGAMEKPRASPAQAAAA
jgi:hypothetical protein